MKALVLAPFSKEALESLGRLMPLTHESWIETKMFYDPEELGLRMKEEGTSHLIVEADFIFEEVFQQASDLRFLGVCRSALDHVDLAAATEHKVLVVNAPGRNAEAVAELTIALMLSLARRIPSLDSYVKTGGWENPLDGYINHQGIELRGKTLGLSWARGCGRRGVQVGDVHGHGGAGLRPVCRCGGATEIRRPCWSPWNNS